MKTRPRAASQPAPPRKKPAKGSPPAKGRTRPKPKHAGRSVRTKARKLEGEKLLIGILSRKASLYTTRRLVEAARAFGHDTVVLDTLRCDLLVQRGAPTVFYAGREARDISVLIPRIGASITRYGLAVVRQFEAMGVPVVNGASGISRSRDKLRSLQILGEAGLQIPRTVMMRDRSQLELAVERIGGLPVIIKLLQGAQGVGVMLAHSFDELESTLDTMWDLEQEILLQEFIAESRGRDVRALVVGDQVVGAMRRVAGVQGEFRSNIHRGGSGASIELPAGYADEAIRAAKAVGLQVAGVDLLESTAGPRIAEINSSPGIEGLERSSGIDVAAAIISFAVHQARSRQAR